MSVARADVEEKPRHYKMGGARASREEAEVGPVQQSPGGYAEPT